jgi:hypothetical protein
MLVSAQPNAFTRDAPLRAIQLRIEVNSDVARVMPLLTDNSYTTACRYTTRCRPMQYRYPRDVRVRVCDFCIRVNIRAVSRRDKSIGESLNGRSRVPSIFTFAEER